MSNHTSRDSSSAKKKRGGQLQQQVESDVQEHEDDDLDISEESGTRIAGHLVLCLIEIVHLAQPFRTHLMFPSVNLGKLFCLLKS